MRITDAHVLLTGATGTLGASLARQLAARGARLTLLARTPAALDALAHETGGSAVEADLCDRDGLRGLVDRVEEQQGPIDVLLNNAGICPIGMIEKDTKAMAPVRTRQPALTTETPLAIPDPGTGGLFKSLRHGTTMRQVRRQWR